MIEEVHVFSRGGTGRRLHVQGEHAAGSGWSDASSTWTTFLEVFDSNLYRAIALFSNWGELQNINSEASIQQGRCQSRRSKKRILEPRRNRSSAPQLETRLQRRSSSLLLPVVTTTICDCEEELSPAVAAGSGCRDDSSHSVPSAHPWLTSPSVTFSDSKNTNQQVFAVLTATGIPYASHSKRLLGTTIHSQPLILPECSMYPECREPIWQ